MGALLDIRGLDVCFGAVEAVRGVNLIVDEGEVLGLVGESGSGKSATALAIMGLLPPTAKMDGQILWRSTGEGSEVHLLRQTPERMRARAGGGAHAAHGSHAAPGGSGNIALFGRDDDA